MLCKFRRKNNEFLSYFIKTVEKNEVLLGYSTEGLHYLTGNKHFNPELPFSRQEFITVKPKKQQGMSISGFQPKLQLIIEEDHFDRRKSTRELHFKAFP